MLSGKQRARLRSCANELTAIFQVGKDGISDMLVKQIDEALTARELIKLRVLDTAPLGAREAAETLAKATESEVIQVIGTRFVLYRRGEKGAFDELL